MLRFELTTQLVRVRTLIALACLAGVPVAAAVLQSVQIWTYTHTAKN